MKYGEKLFMDKINLFFAVDDNYCPFLSTTLHSIFKNANRNYDYDVYVLNTGLKEESKQKVNQQISDQSKVMNIKINFVDVTERLKEISNKLFTRDYFSQTTYFRLFIPNMFPELNKALYLDSDIIVNGDIAELYRTDLTGNLVGAIPDMVIQNIPILIDYVEKGLGIKAEKYYNAGILLMNLEEMRKSDFENEFIELLGKYKFRVAQDQDYLNTITKDRVAYVDYSWNVQPIPNNVCPTEVKNLIHYNMLRKPWIFEETLYADYFWDNAKECIMFDEILKMKNSFTDEKKATMIEGNNKLMALAAEEAESPNNYNNTFNKCVILNFTGGNNFDISRKVGNIRKN